MKVLVSEKLSEHKYKTPEGYLICTDAILARTGKQTYTKDEVFGDGDSTEIDIDRPYDQVMNEKTIASFENKPVTFDHPEEDVNVGNYKDYAIGYVRDVHQGKTDKGEDVIIGNLVITDQDAIDAIEQGDHTDLSCGYDCDIKDDDKGGYMQTNIRGNHVALCEQGRAGNARIVDSRQIDVRLRDEDRQLEVYRLCKQNNWYTSGNIEDYDNMLDNADVWSVEKIAMNIANHSHEGYSSILAKLKSKLKDSIDEDEIDFYDSVTKDNYITDRPEGAFKQVSNALSSYVPAKLVVIGHGWKWKVSATPQGIVADFADNDEKYGNDPADMSRISTDSLKQDLQKYLQSKMQQHIVTVNSASFIKTSHGGIAGVRFRIGTKLKHDSLDDSMIGDSKEMTMSDALKMLNIVDAYKKVKDEYLGMVYINGRPMYVIHKKEPGIPEFWGITPSKWGDNPRKKFKSKKELDDYLTSVNAVSY